MMQKKTEY